MNRFNDPTLNRLAEKAEEYLATDSNASMIKQGMMLEYICKTYLQKTNQIDNVRKRYNNVTLNEMLDYLTEINVIVEGSSTDSLCLGIRLNRNEAAHNFKESEQDARKTLGPLSRFCTKLLEIANVLSLPPEAEKPKWTNPMLIREAEAWYAKENGYAKDYADIMSDEKVILYHTPVDEIKFPEPPCELPETEDDVYLFDAQTTYKNEDPFISAFETIINDFELTEEEMQEIISIDE